MALCTITPFARLATQPGAGFVGMGEEPPLADDLTITAAGIANHVDLPPGTNFVRFNAAAAVHLAIGVAAVATQTPRRLSAGHTEPFAVPLGVTGTVRVSVILEAPDAGVYFDPFDLETLFQDSAGLAPVTAPGDLVRLMLDKSGNGLHATQPVAAARPIFGRTVAGGRRNLANRSEGVLTDYGSRPNMVNAAATIAGFDNAIEYNATDETKYAYMAGGLADGQQTGSVYVEMTDGLGAPAFPSATQNSALNAFRLVVANGGGNPQNYEVKHISGNVYRVSATDIIVASSFPQNSGVLRSVGQTRTFKLSGIQIELSATATSYQRIGSALDVTEAGVPELRYLFDDGDRALVATLPALGPDATIIYGSDLGVTMLEDQTIAAGAFDVLRDERLFGMVIETAMTAAEKIAVQQQLGARAGVTS